MFNRLIKMDLAALEQRVAALEAKDKPSVSGKALEAVHLAERLGYEYNISQGWHKWRDPHQAHAAFIFGVPYESVTPEQRQFAKLDRYYKAYGG